MIVNVRKYLFTGLQQEQDAFFREAQKLGIIQFLEKNQSFDSRSFPKEISRLVDALKVLKSHPPVEQEEGCSLTYADRAVDKILKEHAKLEKLYEEQRLLRHEVVRVEVFGKFDPQALKDLEQESGRKVQFFFAKKGAELDIEDENIIYIGSDHGLDYFISFNKTARSYDEMTEMNVEKPVNELRARQREVEVDIHNTEKKLTRLGRYQELLHEAYIEKLNEHHLYSAQDYAANVLEDKVFAVEGWVADNDFLRLKLLLKKHKVYCDEIAIEDDDRIPTEMENRGTKKLGEDLVHIYDTPAVTDKDPSMWVLWAFALFFAIIVGDGGYGLIFLAVAVFLRYKFDLTKAVARRFVNLVFLLSGACILWGILTTSFFGLELAPDNKLRRFSIVDSVVIQKAQYHLQRQDAVWHNWLDKFPKLEGVQSPREFINQGYRITDVGQISYDILKDFTQSINIEIALLIGMIHIIISLLRYLDRNWAAVGWSLFIIGGYLYFPLMLNASSMVHYLLGIDQHKAAEAGLHLIWGGLGLALVLGVMQKKLAGFLEITNVIQIFSDVLSYLRLFALGLSGAMVSATFNHLGMSMPIIPGILVIVLGHTINIALCVMSGVIHGLRLNFLEWYHYSFDGGGRLFKPLRLLRK
ncbi:MAG: V-type ATP synthase subunit I [Chlamydiota bacterium]